jgi:hypothetical protein
MPDWIAKLLQAWALVPAVPIPFAIAFVSIAAAISLAVVWSYRGVLSKRADRRLSNHGDGPGRATAEKENTDALERMVASTIGSRWTPLNEAEIAALSTRLTDIPKIRVQIMYENALGKELAQSFYEAFKLAEWGGAALGIGSGLGHGVTIGQGSGTATIALKSAIETTSQVKVAIVRPDQPQWPGVVFLAVGINSR